MSYANDEGISIDWEDMYNSHSDFPYWRTKDNQLYAIENMSTSHIKNSIKLINKNPNWRKEYLPLLQNELQKRTKYIVLDSVESIIKICNSYKEASTIKFTLGNSNWIIRQKVS